MNSLETHLFDYTLPGELIAQEPLARRDHSRLLVVDRSTGTVSHRTFLELGELLPPGARLFRNDARVLPARLRGFRPSGGTVECLLLAPGEHPDQWRCLVRPAKKLPPGAEFGLAGEYRAKIVDAGPEGERTVAFFPEKAATVTALAERLGEMPLPPYIQRGKDDTRKLRDREQYQTVYAHARKQVAAAAPTAGLHFTPELLDSLSQKGFSTAELTLHVGTGTFQPIKTSRIEDHPIHREIYEIPAETLELLRRPEERGRRVAVGTTTVRSLEDFARRRAKSASPGQSGFAAEADLFVYPPYRFALTDCLITNFHLPRSTLLCLVAAFLAPETTDGIDWLREIYAEAVARRYRFYSYGDAMLIL